MGYYTNHELTVSDDKILDHKKAIEIESGCAGLFEGERCKWYGHRGDMLVYSKEYPGVVFTLKGEGEESGDIWVEYYKGGKMQQCKAKITFDEFYESKLC